MAASMTFRGKKLGLGVVDDATSGSRFPAIFLRAAPDGTPLAIRELWMVGGAPPITDAVPDGDGYLVAVGTVVGPNSFAGVHVDKGSRALSFIARIKRP